LGIEELIGAVSRFPREETWKQEEIHRSVMFLVSVIAMFVTFGQGKQTPAEGKHDDNQETK